MLIIPAALTMVAIAAGIVTPAAAASCPVLSSAVDHLLDYNNSALNILWFVNRGLQRNKRYGCSSGAAVGVYNFALGCDCDAWEQCMSHSVSYTTSTDELFSTPAGECGCCSWWLIMLICVGSLAVVIFLLFLPKIVRKVKAWWELRKLRRLMSGDLSRSEREAEQSNVRELTDIATGPRPRPRPKRPGLKRRKRAGLNESDSANREGVPLTTPDAAASAPVSVDPPSKRLLSPAPDARSADAFVADAAAGGGGSARSDRYKTSSEAAFPNDDGFDERNTDDLVSAHSSVTGSPR